MRGTRGREEARKRDSEEARKREARGDPFSPSRPLVFSPWYLLALSLAGLVLVTACLSPTAVAGADLPEDLIAELICPSPGNPQPLAASSAPEAVWMRSFIRAKAAEGWSRQRIVDTLVRQYGERILPVPPKEGFSLAAWITPFATIFGGSGLLAFLLARWLRERQRHDAYLIASLSRSAADSDLERYEAQLREELARFE